MTVATIHSEAAPADLRHRILSDRTNNAPRAMRVPVNEALDQIGRGFGGGFIQPMIEIILVNVHHGVDECLLVANHQTARVIRMNVGQKYIGDITRINTGHL
jgi:hypothetical protein